MIVDVHAHTYPDRIVTKVIEKLEKASGGKAKGKGTLDSLLESMQEANIDLSILLPVATNPRQVGRLNAQAIQAQNEFKKNGILSFGAIHPDTENMKDVLRAVKNAGLLGIKLHPDYQDAFFDDIRYLRILDAAAELDLCVLVHAGMDEGYPTSIHCDVPRILNVIQHVTSEKLILAHMGSWQMWDDVRKYLCGAPLYFDTAFSLSGTVSIENHPPYGPLLDDEAFANIVRAHGTKKVLFGSDIPWGSQKENVDWIQNSSLTQEEKRDVLGDNALRLFSVDKRNIL